MSVFLFQDIKPRSLASATNTLFALLQKNAVAHGRRGGGLNIEPLPKVNLFEKKGSHFLLI
jgi:hypothetical protein